MSEWLLILLLPLAAWSGWWIAMRKEARDMRQSKSRSAYFEGLSFLLNDQTDRAVDVFLQMANIDRQTFDNQLTLGALFRKRGELDRALHLHRQLADLPFLDNTQACAVDFELAEDYAHAGMFRQAQALLEKRQGENFRTRDIYAALWRIYERTAQWQKAIEISELWQAAGYGSRARQIAHYYCELAEIAQIEGDTSRMHTLLAAALVADNRCGRAYHMQAQLAMQRGEPVSAIHHYHSIGEQAANFLPEILPLLAEAYAEIGRSEEYLQWLLEKEAQMRQARLSLATAETLSRLGKAEAAHQLLQSRLQEQQNPLLLAAYLQSHPEPSLQGLNTLIGKGISPQHVYQCNECGFRQQRLIWHCPACHAWSSFQPLIEVKVEQR